MEKEKLEIENSWKVIEARRACFDYSRFIQTGAEHIYRTLGFRRRVSFFIIRRQRTSLFALTIVSYLKAALRIAI